jgi:type II secretory pathway pseudopilin PulG
MLSISKALQSSKAAIDLASIMVGVIIIGLIGGVIAATVFAVIPWSQDKAAKQQLDSIHTAENAYFGLSSDATQSLVGGKKNSFASSTELASNNLLTSNSNYCVVNTSDGKDYHAYSKSGSGKTFYALNSKRTAQEYTGAFPCISDSNGVSIVDPAKDNGTTPVGTVPASNNEVVYSTDLESEPFNTAPTGWTQINTSGTSTSINLKVKSSSSTAVNANKTYYYYTAAYTNYLSINSGKVLEASSVSNNHVLNSPFVTLTPGKYSASAYTAKGSNGSWNNWSMNVKKGTNAAVSTTVASSSWVPGYHAGTTTSAYNWETHTVEFTVTQEGTYFLSWTGNGTTESTSPVMIDDVKIIKTGTL